MPTPTGPTVRRRRLASELRRLREEAGLERRDVAGETALSEATISRIENARVGVTVTTVRALLNLYDVDDPQLRAELEGHARAGKQQNWWSQYAGAVNAGFTTYIGLEADAAEVHEYQALAIPGLLQTEAYARATVSPVGLAEHSGDVTERRVRVRMQRQKRLTGPQPLELHAVIDEAVIRRTVGGPGVMREQLKHLAEAARLPNVRLQVVPLRHAREWTAVIGSFVVLGFPDPVDPPVAYVEGFRGDTFHEGDAVRDYNALFAGLQAAGVSYAESIEMIETAADST